MPEKNMLFTPFKIGNKVAPNRFGINAMECCDADENGNPSKRTYERYEKLFEGKAGFIDLEAITCQYKHRSRVDQLSILPHNAKPLEKFVSHLKSINSDNIFIFQLTHSGEISLSKPGVSTRIRVSDEPLYGYEDAVQIGDDEIEVIMDEFVQAAKIAYDAGADGVDLKFCHGYLGSQILRPYNQANWKYGGSWEKRRQYAFDLTERVIKAINDPNFIVGSKVSMYEAIPGGQGTAGPDSAVMDLTESIDLIKGLEERGAKYIMQSAGTPSHTCDFHMPNKNKPDDGYMHMYFQKVCRDNLKPETAVLGSAYSIFRNGKGTKFNAVAPEKNSMLYWGDKNIRDHVTDFILLGRQSFADPYLPIKAIEGRENEIHWCTACNNCIELMIRQNNVGCATYNPEYTQLLKEVRAEFGKLVDVHT